MINYEALFKITYGLYIVCAGTEKKGNGFISNTVFQVTSEPPRFATCCNKENHTVGFIRSTGAFSVSVLREDAGALTMGTFGYKSGKDADKLKGFETRYGETGVPIVLTDALAILELRVTKTIDMGTHLMFIGELLHSELLDENAEPLTYQYYRNVKKGEAPKNAPTYIDKSKLVKAGPQKTDDKYQCPVCGFIYDEAKEGAKFDDLPDDWVCPVCGEAKSEFKKT